MGPEEEDRVPSSCLGGLLDDWWVHDLWRSPEGRSPETEANTTDLLVPVVTRLDSCSILSPGPSPSRRDSVYRP